MIFGVLASYKKKAPCAIEHKGQTLPAYWRNGFLSFRTDEVYAKAILMSSKFVQMWYKNHTYLIHA